MKLAEGVYVDIGNADSNSGVVVLEHAVLVFDTHFTPEAGQALLAKIRAITANPVQYIVNSHFHPDHTHGNQAFSKARCIIGSTEGRRDMLQKDLPAMNRTLGIAQTQLDKMRKDILQEQNPSQKELLRKQIAARQDFLDRMSHLKILAPTVALDDSLSILDQGRELRLLFWRLGHTEGDIALFLPKEKILFLGDLFFNAAIPSTQDATLLEWMNRLSEILKLDAETFIPGHGPVGKKKDVQDFLAYFKELKGLVEPAVTRGDPIEQVIRDVRLPANFSSYGFPDFFPANLQKMYVELKAQQLASISNPPEEVAKKPESEKP